MIYLGFIDVSSNEIGDDSGVLDVGFSSHKGRSWKMGFGPFDCMYGKRMIQPDVCDIVVSYVLSKNFFRNPYPCSTVSSLVPRLFFFGKPCWLQKYLDADDLSLRVLNDTMLMLRYHLIEHFQQARLND